MDLELARRRVVEEYEILDTPQEPLYDALTKVARDLFGARAAMISILDGERQWFKSRIGVDLPETPRKFAFWNEAMATHDPMVVPDASLDARFANNPYVTGDPYVRFYVSVPLTSPEGFTIGTVCVVDSKPGDASARALDGLKAIATAIMDMLESRRRFLSLIERTHTNFLTIDVSTQTVTFASRGAAARLGYPRRELSGMPVYDLIPSLRKRALTNAIDRIRGGTPLVREVEVLRKDGTKFPAELRLDVSIEDGHERILAIATDVTERHEAKREIDLLLGAVNAAGDVILVYRVDERGALRLDYMNDAYARQTGYSQNEALGRDLDSFRKSMPDDDGMRSIRAAIAKGDATEAELVSYRKDGTTYWNQLSLHPVVNGTGKITHWISVERDITDVVDRTSELAEEHDRLLSLTQAVRRLFSALEGHGLCGAVREVLGELLGARARVIAVAESGAMVEASEIGIVDFDAPFQDDLIAEVVSTEARAVDLRGERAAAYAGRFGENRYVVDLRAPAAHRLRSTDLFVFDLVTEYFAVAARNVTLYQELDERRTAVLELNQTKSDLIAMLAHDFRGPLTSIVGFADLTSEVGEVSGEQRDFLETIKRSALQLSDLASDTLTLSRLERNEVALQLADVDVGELLTSIAELYKDRRPVELAIVGDATVVGDEERLRQVFSNLVDNAIKYSPGGIAPQVTVESQPDRVTVRLRDFGIGIPQGELASVFDRFSRASNARRMRIQGTGFGLFLTKQLVQLHGGTIAVESKEGDGSTFEVTLPRRVARKSAPRAIVVLDPDRDRSFLVYGLREAGYRIMTAATLEELFAIADGQSVDGLIVSTPELSAERAVQLRAFSRERSIPIVAVANETSKRLGASATLLRPVLISDVVAALDRVL